MPPTERVLILAAHGSSHPAARGALEAFAALAAARRPELCVRLARTGSPRPVGHGSGSPGPGLGEVLAGLDDGVRDIRVQSLHVIAGGEFDRMRRMIEEHAGRSGAGYRLAGPLLSGPGDAPAVARALAGCLGAAAGPDRAVVLMGHGTTHDAQELYRALSGELGAALPGARLGVLEAADPDDPLSIRAIARDLQGRGVREAVLAPFLTVAGRHAHKDLAGEQEGSWLSVLAAHGVACTPDLAGLIERKAFSEAWLDSIDALAGPADAFGR